MFVALVISLISLSFAQEIDPASDSNPRSLTRAEQLFFTGQKHYEAGKYDQAIVAWRTGYELSKRAAFLQNIALAQEDSGDYAGAAKTLYEYWPLLDPQDQPPIKEWIVDLEKKSALQQAALPDEKAFEPSPGALAEMPRVETVEHPKHTWVMPTSWGVLALSTTAATVATIMTSSVHSELTGMCGPINDELLCYSQAKPLIDEHNQLRWSTAALWTIAAAGAFNITLLMTRTDRGSTEAQILSQVNEPSDTTRSLKVTWQLPPLIDASTTISKITPHDDIALTQ